MLSRYLHYEQSLSVGSWSVSGYDTGLTLSYPLWSASHYVFAFFCFPWRSLSAATLQNVALDVELVELAESFQSPSNSCTNYTFKRKLIPAAMVSFGVNWT